jgi:hypothetical protein
LLLEHNADPNAGMYPSASCNHVDIIHLLRQYGANNWNDVLQAACHNHRVTMIELMINFGADKCDCNGNGDCQRFFEDINY